jgi:AcrR family transcriptional regulator
VKLGLAERRKPLASALRTGPATSTRRQRLSCAIVEIVAERGYERATVAQIIRVARVSRLTFYKLFASKEEGFLAAVQEIERSVLASVSHSIEADPRQSAAAAAITALTTFAQEQPTHAQLLMNATMAAGPQALDARDHGVNAIARLVEDADRHARTSNSSPALPAEIVIGTAYRLIGSRLRRGEHGKAAMNESLLDWIATYEDANGESCWHSLALQQAPARPPSPARGPLRSPPPVPPGRPRRSAPAVIENQRLRIIFAAAQIIQRDGYPEASVAEITRAARVDGRIFYSLFSDKHDAFRALREFAFLHAMAVTAGAFFAVKDWPRRIWEAARAFAEFLEQNPVLTYACLIESDAGGPETVQRFEDLVAGCTIFLQEGYGYRPHDRDRSPSHVVLDAIAQAELELIYRQARSGSNTDITGLAAQVAYICLVPFVGATTASELINEMDDG